jgi:hypothetical protein
MWVAFLIVLNCSDTVQQLLFDLLQGLPGRATAEKHVDDCTMLFEEC